MEIILNIIKQLLTFTMILKLVENLSVNQYRKYIKLISGLLVIVFILCAINGLVSEMNTLMDELRKGVEVEKLERYLEVEE